MKAKLDVYAPLADKAKADAAAKAVAEKKNADAALKNALDGANRAADQASAALDNAETKLAELQAAYTKNCEAAPDTAGCPKDKKELDAQTKKASDAKDELQQLEAQRDMAASTSRGAKPRATRRSPWASSTEIIPSNYMYTYQYIR